MYSGQRSAAGKSRRKLFAYLLWRDSEDLEGYRKERLGHNDFSFGARRTGLAKLT